MLARGHGDTVDTRGPEAQRLGGSEEHLRVSGLGSRVSGTGYQVRVRVRVLNLTLVLNT